jgi:transcriptional regulator with GAF, ATPase, and Fis domain
MVSDDEQTASGTPAPADHAGDGGVLLVTGAAQLTTHILAGDEIAIGRAPECAVVINDAALSRRHALLRLGPPMTIQDLGSTNGTRVARNLLKGGEPVPLAVGESFHIGAYSLVVLRTRRGNSELSPSQSANMLRVTDPTEEHASGLVRDLAKSGVNVLILGETGVGKEVLSETLHQLSGRSGPLVRINCAALSSSLLESELFGHEKGAFTGALAAKPGLLEAARGGTAFLDEIGELPASVQAKLLRAIEAKEVLRLGAVRPVSIEVRFLAATNRDLPAEVAHGHFRSDLYFRLDGVTLHIPPLRERRGMILPLALQFLQAAHVRLGGRGKPKISPELLPRIEAHTWPGNVRELKAAMERAVLLARGREIGLSHLQLAQTSAETRRPDPREATRSDSSEGSEPGDLTPEQLADRQRIVAALEQCVGNQTRAARLLGISRATLVTRLALYRIPRPRK